VVNFRQLPPIRKPGSTGRHVVTLGTTVTSCGPAGRTGRRRSTRGTVVTLRRLAPIRKPGSTGRHVVTLGTVVTVQGLQDEPAAADRRAGRW
jgi:hypothetical protein